MRHFLPLAYLQEGDIQVGADNVLIGPIVARGSIAERQRSVDGASARQGMRLAHNADTFAGQGLLLDPKHKRTGIVLPILPTKNVIQH